MNSHAKSVMNSRVQGTNYLYKVYKSMHFSCNFVYKNSWLSIKSDFCNQVH